MNDLLNSTKPIIYETENDELPYALAGTCFPVRYGNDLYIVSADHCFSNHRVEPRKTMYLSPVDGRTAFAFDLQIRASCPAVSDTKHHDQIVLRVAHCKHTQEEINRVHAIDLADPESSRLPTNSNVRDIVLRGYPFKAPKYAINYDDLAIKLQAYVTNGCVSTTASPFDFCYYIRLLTPIPNGMAPIGMSGSPLYGVTRAGSPVFCGMIIEYDLITTEYLVIGPEILVNSLRKLDVGAN